MEERNDTDIDEEEDFVSFETIEALQSHGVNVSDINKLKDAGYGTVGQLFQVPAKALLQVKGISEAKLDKIMQAGRKVILYSFKQKAKKNYCRSYQSMMDSWQLRAW